MIWINCDRKGGDRLREDRGGRRDEDIERDRVRERERHSCLSFKYVGGRESRCHQCRVKCTYKNVIISVMLPPYWSRCVMQAGRQCRIISPPGSPGGGKRREQAERRETTAVETWRHKRSVLPLEFERWQCGASGQPGPWGPAGLRRKPSFLQDTVGAQSGRSVSWTVSG